MKIVMIDYKKSKKKQPYPSAMLEDVVETENRSWKTIELAKQTHMGREFLENGTNHREMVDTSGEKYIAREHVLKEWIVNVFTMEELLVILKETGGEMSYNPLISIPLVINIEMGPA